MKKQVLLFTALLIGLTTVAANKNMSVKTADDLNFPNNRYAEPVIFMERGIEFMVFPNGSFDFNTNTGTPNSYFEGNYYYRSSATTRRNSVNSTFGAPPAQRPVRYANPRNQGVIVTHDTNGKVRRIGNVFINYDRQGKIKRAGSIYMRYSQNGLLKQVGGLHIYYNYWGEIISQFGFVNTFNAACQVCGVHNCRITHGAVNSGFNFGNTHDTEAEDVYYYKNGDSNATEIESINTPKAPIKRRK